jgi:Domain of unknown function (DUF1911)/Domain of unknown function (DUF1910)
MIRTPLGKKAYWDLRIIKGVEWLKKVERLLSEPSLNPGYDPQFTFDQSKGIFRLMLCHYSRGDTISSFAQHFPSLLDAWELSNTLATELNAELKPGERWDHRHLLTTPIVTDDLRGHTDPRAWIFNLSNLNHYNWCFWLVGLALALEIPDEHWQRLLALIGGAGDDILLDRIIAVRQPEREMGTTLLHPKPYARLLKAIDAPVDEQAALLFQFVQHWYAELARKGHEELWWYIYGDPVKHPLEMGSYFGRWCIEAVAAVKAFNLDDSLCLGHEHYPGDLLRPNEPSTHKPPAPEKTGFWRKWLATKGV